VAEAGRPIRAQRKGSHGGMGGASTDGATAEDRPGRPDSMVVREREGI